MTQFIIIRQEHLELIPAEYGRSLRQAAAALLEYFKNQREGWLTFNLPQLCETLLYQWGRETIRKAAELLDELGLIKRRHHRINGRAWQYQYLDQKSVTVTSESVTVAPESVTATPERVTSLYDPFLDQQQDPEPADEQEVGISEEEFNQACTKIREIRCTPAIDLNEAVRKEVRASWQNLEKAIAYLKHCLRTWDGRRQYNWTGVLIKALREGQSPPDFCREKQISQIPVPPDGLEDWVIERLDTVKDFFFSSVNSCWMVVYFSGHQQPAVEAMGGKS